MKYEIDGLTYDVIIERKRIKHLYIRFKNNNIVVTSSFLTTNKNIYDVLNKNIESIRKMITRDNKEKDTLFLGNHIDIVGISNLKNPEYNNGKLYVKDRGKIDDAYKYLAGSIFRERLDYIYNLFEENIPYPNLRIRKMTSRWGVCNRRSKTITLNLELIKWDYIYIDYVIIHELSHFVHFNHSSSFWDTVSKYCPSYKILRKNLRE
jgi:predicted metal-dependent hydrolase